MSDLLNFEMLLKDIPGAEPAGRDLRKDPASAYHRLKLAFGRAVSAERKLLEGEETQPPDWDRILEGVPEVIAAECKDLDLAAWLAEALTRKHGLPGLRDGLKLIRLLVERFWDQGLHLTVDSGNATEAFPVLDGLGGTPSREGRLIGPICRVRLTESSEGVGPFSYLDYQEAARIESIKDSGERLRAIEKGMPDPQKIARAERATSSRFREETVTRIRECKLELDGLDSALAAKCPGSLAVSLADLTEWEALVLRLKNPPDDPTRFLWDRLPVAVQQSLASGAKETTGPVPLKRALADELNRIAEGEPIFEAQRFAGVTLEPSVKTLLEQQPTGRALRRLNRILLRQTLGLSEPARPPSTAMIRRTLETCESILTSPGENKADEATPHLAGDTAGSPTDVAADGSLSGPIRSRQDAFRILLRVAQYFEQTEPHSPASYALRRVVRWGDLPLPALLAELIENDDARKEVYNLVGIVPKSGE